MGDVNSRLAPNFTQSLPDLFGSAIFATDLDEDSYSSTNLYHLTDFMSSASPTPGAIRRLQLTLLHLPLQLSIPTPFLITFFAARSTAPCSVLSALILPLSFLGIVAASFSPLPFAAFLRSVFLVVLCLLPNGISHSLLPKLTSDGSYLVIPIFDFHLPLLALICCLPWWFLPGSTFRLLPQPATTQPVGAFISPTWILIFSDHMGPFPFLVKGSNNTAELQAPSFSYIHSLSSIPTNIHLYFDSQYVIDILQGTSTRKFATCHPFSWLFHPSFHSFCRRVAWGY